MGKIPHQRRRKHLRQARENPIRQVRRQIYVLARYLDYYGVPVWVRGCAYLLRGGSPVESPYLLADVSAIARAIHTPGRDRLTAATVSAICALLRDDG